MRLPDRAAQWLLRSLQVGVSGLLVWTLVAGERAREDAAGPNVLRIPVRIEQDVEAHLYYDVGQGLWAGHVEIQHLEGSPDWRVLSFPLPREPIRALRFDPMLTPGMFGVKAPWLESKTGRIIAKFPVTAVTPRHQIAGWRQVEQGYEAITWADADDAQVQFGLGWPLRVGEPRWPWPEAVGLGVLIVALGLLGRHPANRHRRKWRGIGWNAVKRVPPLTTRGLRAVLAAYGSHSRRMIGIGAVVVVLGQGWVLRGLDESLDLPLWDESNSAARGVAWAADGGALGDLHTGPAYVAVYAAMALWGEAPEIVFWQHYGVKIGGTLLLYLLLVKWWQRWPAALAVALAWGCTVFQTAYPLLVYQSAWMWFVAALIVIERWALLGLMLLIWTVGFRQDYQFVLPVAVGAVAWRWWRAGKNGKNLWSRGGGETERIVVQTILVLSGLTLAWGVTHVSWGGVGKRGWFAFQQHYAVRAVIEGEAVGINPLADYPEVMAEDFPGATSLREAWTVNRPAVVRHVRWNVQQAMLEGVKLWQPQAATLLAFMALAAAALVALLLDAQGRGHGERMGAAGWVGIVVAAGALVVVGPGLVVLAKGPYLLPVVPIVLYGLGVLVRAMGQRLPALDQLNGAVVGSVTLALGLILLGTSEPVFERENPVRPVAERVAALGEIWPAEGAPTLVAYGASSYANYLGNARCHGVEPINAVTGDAGPDRDLVTLVAEESPFAVMITDDWLASSPVDESVLAGWSVREVPGGRLYWREN